MRLFTIETIPSEKRIEIYLNKEGLDFFIKYLERKRKLEHSEHYHLATEDWGGDELSNQLQSSSEDAKLINHMKFHFWTDEDAKEVTENNKVQALICAEVLENEHLYFHLNKEGADCLINQLKYLINSGSSGYINLLSPEKGGVILWGRQNIFRSPYIELFHHLQIHYIEEKNEN